MTVRVSSIEWLSREAEEAIVDVDDGRHRCRTFCHPCQVKQGDMVLEPLIAFDSSKIERVSSEVEQFKSMDSPFGYSIRAVVTSIAEPILAVGKILIELDVPLPGDIQKGEVVDFECERLDFIR